METGHREVLSTTFDTIGIRSLAVQNNNKERENINYAEFIATRGFEHWHVSWLSFCRA
jgi:hypothetical protein